MTKFEKVRQEQFPVTSRLAYLDTSSSGLISKNAKDAMVSCIADRYENGFDIAKVNGAWAHADAMRTAVAEMFNASPEEIFFGGAASTIINVFSGGIQLKDNANVVVSGLSFPSTPYTWFNRVGAENVRIAQPINSAMPAQQLFDLVDEHTAVSPCARWKTRQDSVTISRRSALSVRSAASILRWISRRVSPP